MTGSAAAPGEASAAASTAKPATPASGERIAGAAKRCAAPPTAAAVSPRNAWRRVIEQNRHISGFLPPGRSRAARRYPTVARGESEEPTALEQKLRQGSESEGRGIVRVNSSQK